MSTDYSAIRSKFVSVVQSGVGSLLSTTGPPSATEPSVIIRRPSGPIPDYPYISLDILDTEDQHGWLSFEEVDVNDNPVYLTYEKMLINIRCYGGDSISIINKLRHYLRIASVRNDIREVLSGSIVDVLDIDSMPIELSDRFLESASVNIIFNTITSQVDTSVGIIDNVDLDGQVFRDDEDPTPYTTTIIAP